MFSRRLFCCFSHFKLSLIPTLPLSENSLLRENVEKLELLHTDLMGKYQNSSKTVSADVFQTFDPRKYNGALLPSPVRAAMIPVLAKDFQDQRVVEFFVQSFMSGFDIAFKFRPNSAWTSMAVNPAPTVVGEETALLKGLDEELG